jgi:DNA-binding MarR family transcriptional regulator
VAAEHPATPRDGRSAELFGVLARIVHRTTQDTAAALRAEGLDPARFQLLRAVRAAPGETQQTFGVTRGNVSMLVTELVGAGPLVREPRGAADGLRLTVRGEELVRRLEPEQTRFLTERRGGGARGAAGAAGPPVGPAAAQRRLAAGRGPAVHGRLGAAGVPAAVPGGAGRPRRNRAAQAALAGTVLPAGVARARVDRAPRESVPLSLALATGSLAGWERPAGSTWRGWWWGRGRSRRAGPRRPPGWSPSWRSAAGRVATLPARAATPLQRAYGVTPAWAPVVVADGRRANSRPVAVAAAVAALPVLRRLR